MAEPTTIGLSEAGHKRLKDLKELGIVRDMTDGYRLAIAVAIAHGAIAGQVPGRTTIFNVGTLDAEREIYGVVQLLREETDEDVYRTVERLAEWGVEELGRQLIDKKGSVLDLLEEAKALANKPVSSAP